MDPDPDLGGPKTCGSGSGKLLRLYVTVFANLFVLFQIKVAPKILVGV